VEHLIKSGPVGIKVSEMMLSDRNPNVIQAEVLSQLAKQVHEDCRGCKHGDLRTERFAHDMSVGYSVCCKAKECKAAGWTFNGPIVAKATKRLTVEDVLKYAPESIVPRTGAMKDVPQVEGAGDW